MAFFWQNPTASLLSNPHSANPLNRAKRIWTGQAQQEARRYMTQHLMEFIDVSTGEVDYEGLARAAAYELDAPEWMNPSDWNEWGFRHPIERLAYDIAHDDQRIIWYRDHLPRAKELAREARHERRPWPPTSRRGSSRGKTAGDVYGRGRLP